MEGQNKGITSTNGLIDSWVPRNFRFLGWFYVIRVSEGSQMYWKQVLSYAKPQEPALAGRLKPNEVLPPTTPSCSLQLWIFNPKREIINKCGA